MTEFTVTKQALGAFLPGMESELGIGNRLRMVDEELLKNLCDISFGMDEPVVTLAPAFVEMGARVKTYVYRDDLRMAKGRLYYIVCPP